MIELSDRERREICENTAIATITFYRPNNESDTYRSHLAKDTIRKAADSGCKVIVADGGSSDELLRDFERYGATLISSPEDKNMGPRMRKAIKCAYDSGRPINAWSEAEKEDYVLKIPYTAVPILEGRADMTVPKRKSMQSYPTAQQLAEPVGNLCWKILTGTDLDLWFSPRTWRRDMSDYFLKYKGEYGDQWEANYIPVMYAAFDGKKILGVEIEYNHPSGQTDLEENDFTFDRKRLKQLNFLTFALKDCWDKLHADQVSR